MEKFVQCKLESVTGPKATIILETVPATGTEERVSVTLGEYTIIVDAAEFVEAAKAVGDQ